MVRGGVSVIIKLPVFEGYLDREIIPLMKKMENLSKKMRQGVLGPF